MAHKKYPEETVYFNPAQRRQAELALTRVKGALKKCENKKFGYWIARDNKWHLCAEKYVCVPPVLKGKKRKDCPPFNVYTCQCGRCTYTEKTFLVYFMKDAPFDKRITPPVGQMAKWHPEGVCGICYTIWQRKQGMRARMQKRADHIKSVLTKRKRRKELEST